MPARRCATISRSCLSAAPARSRSSWPVNAGPPTTTPPRTRSARALCAINWAVYSLPAVLIGSPVASTRRWSAPQLTTPTPATPMTPARTRPDRPRRRSERVVADLALHRQPLTLRERLDVGREAAHRAPVPDAARPPNGTSGSSSTVCSLMWTIPLGTGPPRIVAHHPQGHPQRQPVLRLRRGCAARRRRAAPPAPTGNEDLLRPGTVAVLDVRQHGRAVEQVLVLAAGEQFAAPRPDAVLHHLVHAGPAAPRR